MKTKRREYSELGWVRSSKEYREGFTLNRFTLLLKRDVTVQLTHNVILSPFSYTFSVIPPLCSCLCVCLIREAREAIISYHVAHIHFQLPELHAHFSDFLQFSFFFVSYMNDGNASQTNKRRRRRLHGAELLVRMKKLAHSCRSIKMGDKTRVEPAKGEKKSFNGWTFLSFIPIVGCCRVPPEAFV